MKNIIFLFLLFSNIVIGQNSADLELSGHLTVQFGDQVMNPDDVIIELIGEGKISSTDSVGYFEFRNLKSKEYNLRVLNYSSDPQIFKVKLNNRSKKDVNLFLKVECEVNAETAKKDINEGNPKLLLASGIAPAVYYGGDPFEKKYNIEFQDFGDVIEHPSECMKQYNKEIFKYLDEKFGQQWRREVREDVIGLK